MLAPLRVVRDLGNFMTGEKAEKLGAGVREVREARVLSGDAGKLLKAMGCTEHYRVRRRGYHFRLLLAGQVVDVSLLLLEVKEGLLVPGHWLVETTCKTTQEEYPAAVAALMEAAEMMAGHVEMRKPELGLRPR